MSYWQRVDIEQATVSRSPIGAEVLTWSVLESQIEARVLPLILDEKLQQWATPEEAAYEVQLRGAWPQVALKQRVALSAGVYLDIRQVHQPPPFGSPSTVLGTVLVTP